MDNDSPLTAANADKHHLYEASVQDVEEEAKHLKRFFKKTRGEKPVTLKEDFCGTAALCHHWVTLSNAHTAVGLDIDPDVLHWSRNHHSTGLEGTEAERLQLLNQNVLEHTGLTADITVALNFSYYVFKTRKALIEYFKVAKASLNERGVFICDAFGGADAHLEGSEETELDDFTYVWEHATFKPVTHDLKCHIHFDFPDGTRLKKAFTYHWRLWTLPELRECLHEAGFEHVDVYMEGIDEETFEGNGVFKKTKRGEAVEGWLAHIVSYNDSISTVSDIKR